MHPSQPAIHMAVTEVRQYQGSRAQGIQDGSNQRANLELRRCVSGETIDGHHCRDAELARVLNVALNVCAPGLHKVDVLVGVLMWQRGAWGDLHPGNRHGDEKGSRFMPHRDLLTSAEVGEAGMRCGPWGHRRGFSVP